MTIPPSITLPELETHEQCILGHLTFGYDGKLDLSDEDRQILDRHRGERDRSGIGRQPAKVDRHRGHRLLDLVEAGRVQRHWFGLIDGHRVSGSRDAIIGADGNHRAWVSPQNSSADRGADEHIAFRSRIAGRHRLGKDHSRHR